MVVLGTNLNADIGFCRFDERDDGDTLGELVLGIVLTCSNILSDCLIFETLVGRCDGFVTWTTLMTVGTIFVGLEMNLTSSADGC